MRAGRRRAGTLLVVAVATSALVCGAGEPAARGVIDRRVAAAAGRALGVAPDRVAVDTGGGPALLALAHRRLGHVELSGDDVTVGRLTGASVRVRMDGLRFGAEPTVSATHAEVRVPAGSAAARSGDIGDGGLPVSAVVPDPATGTLRLELGGGIGRVTVRPALRDGRVALTVTGAEFLGRAAAPAVADRIERRLAERVPRARYPLALRATSVEVTSGGLHVILDGGRAALPRRAVQAA